MSAARPKIDRARLLQLAHDLPAAWNAASADTRIKQRLVIDRRPSFYEQYQYDKTIRLPGI